MAYNLRSNLWVAVRSEHEAVALHYDGFTGHSGRVGIGLGPDEKRGGAMTAGRWKSSCVCLPSTPSARQPNGVQWPGITRKKGIGEGILLVNH